MKAGSIRVEFEDLALADFGLQVVTCQRVKKELVEGILESFATPGGRRLDDDSNGTWHGFSQYSLGAAPALGADQGGLNESDARDLLVQRR